MYMFVAEVRFTNHPSDNNNTANMNDHAVSRAECIAINACSLCVLAHTPCLDVRTLSSSRHANHVYHLGVFVEYSGCQC